MAAAFVARMDVDHIQYLSAATAGKVEWVPSPAQAATFLNVREATREALRLPSGLRAFAYPRV